MSAKQMLIPEITPVHQKWTAKIIVAEKSYPKTSFYSTKNYQTLLLMDMEGNTVRAMIWDHHILAFENVLILGNTYLISNAMVRLTPEKYKKFDGELQWTLSGTTRVEDVDELHHDLIFSKLHLCPYPELRSYMDNKSRQISYIAMVLDVKPKRPFYTKNGNQTTVQDVILMDKEFNTVTLTMWSSFTDNECQQITNLVSKTPVIIATELVVTSFNGLSLSTTSDSFFYINFPFNEVKEYQTWINANLERIAEITSSKPYSTPKKITALENTTFTTVKDVLELAGKLQQTRFWIKGCATVKMNSSPFWYMGCNLCFRASCATTAGECYDCRYCNTANVTAIPRARADIYIEDETGILPVSTMGEVAEDYLQCSAFKLMGISKGRISDGNLRLNIEDQYVFYVKAIPATNSPNDRGKAQITTFQPISKFELISLEEYVPSKFKQAPTVTTDDNSSVIPVTIDAISTVSHSSTSPPAKRTLFSHEAAMSPTKKKLNDKLD